VRAAHHQRDHAAERGVEEPVTDAQDDCDCYEQCDREMPGSVSQRKSDQDYSPQGIRNDEHRLAIGSVRQGAPEESGAKHGNRLDRQYETEPGRRTRQRKRTPGQGDGGGLSSDQRNTLAEPEKAKVCVAKGRECRSMHVVVHSGRTLGRFSAIHISSAGHRRLHAAETWS
jgi:hypothetical protein